MSAQLPDITTVCSEYQRLLEESQRALEIWNEVRAEVCQSRLNGKAAGDELLRLQAKYARAYTRAAPRAQLLSLSVGVQSKGTRF